MADSGINQVQIIIAATDRATAVISQTTQEMIKMGEAAVKAGNEAAVAIGAVLVGALLNAKEAFIGLYKTVEATDSLLRKFANTTLKDVITSAIDGIVEDLSNAMNFSVTDILKTLGETAKVSLGFEIDQPGLSKATNEVDRELDRLKRSLSEFNDVASVEFDLLALKIEESFGLNGEYLVGEFERVKERLVQIAKEGGVDASVEIELAALRLQGLADQKGIAISFDPTIQAARAAEAQIEDLSVQTTNTVAESVKRAAGSIINGFDRTFNELRGNYENVVGKITGASTAISGIAFSISGGEEAVNLFNSIKDSAGQAIGVIQSVSEQIFFFSQALDILQTSVISGPYETLIGQNVRLREQLLATQSTLAATNRVLQNGVQIKDPTIAIQSLSGPVNTALAQIRKESLDLVNVTSKDLVDSFQIIAAQAGNIGFNLTQAKDLTISFGATLGTLGVPLFMANQEINSILTGQIDVNSVVAKSLGITNQQVAIWRQQGTLVDNLNKKMEAFRAGNKLASQTLGGVTSNIQELVDNVGLAAGGKALDLIVEKASKLYAFLKQNQETITKFVTEIVTKLSGSLEVLVDGLAAVFGSTQALAVNTIRLLFDALSEAITALGNALKTVAVIAAPFLNILAELAKMGNLLNPLFQVAVQMRVLGTAVSFVTGSLGALSRSLPLVGELLFLMQLRGNGVLGMLTGLNQAAGIGASGFLTLGANLNKIPFLFNAVANKFPIFGKEIASLIPTVSKGGTALIALGQKVPGISKFIEDVGQKAAESGAKGGQAFASLSKGLASFISSGGNADGIKGLATGLAEATAESSLLAPLSGVFKNIAENTDLASAANQKFAEVMTEVRGTVIRLILNFGAITLIVAAAAIAINEFLIKNEANRRILVNIGNAIKGFGENVIKFFTSPLGIATLAVTGLTIAIRTGLITTIIDAAKSFAALTAANTPQWFSLVAREAVKFNETLRSVSQGDFGAIFGGKKQDLQQRADLLQQGLRDTAGEYKKSVADRNARIAQIDQELPLADPSKARVTGRKPIGDFEALTAEKERILQELNEITTARKSQGAALASLRAEAAAIPTVSQQIGSTLSNAYGKATATAEQFRGVAQRLGGDSLIRLGQAAAGLGFEQFGQKLAFAGNNMFAFGTQTLQSEKSLKGLLGAIDVSNVSINGIGEGVKRAAGSVKNFASTVITASQGMLAAAGPTLAFIVAITTITTAIQGYIDIAEAGGRASRQFADAVKESDEKVAQVERQRAAREGKPIGGGGAGFNEADEQDKRRKEINQRKNIVQKLFEGALPTVLGQTTGSDQLELQAEIDGTTKGIKQAQDKLKQLQESKNKIGALESDNAELQKKRTELAAKGDSKGVEEVDGRLKQNQEQIDAIKANADAAIGAAQKIRPLTQQQAKDQAELVNKLKDTRAEYDKIRDIKIAPLELPRVGSAVEQFSNQVQAGLDALEKGGNKEDVENKLKITLDATKQLLQAGAITEEQSREVFARVAASDRVSIELQQQAQEGLTGSYQTEAQKRVEIKQREEARIKAEVQAGKISEAEGERQLTQLKLDQAEIQFNALKDQFSKENQLAADQLQRTQANTTQEIVAAREKIKAAQNNKDVSGKRLSPTEAKEQLEAGERELKAAEKRQLTAQDAYNTAVNERNRQLVNKEKEYAAQRIEAQKTINNSYVAESQRRVQLIQKDISAIEELQAQGRVSDGKADSDISRLKEKSLQAELDGINRAIKETKAGSDERIALEEKAAKISADIAKNRTDFQIREIDRVTQRAIDAAKQSSIERQTQAQKLFNEGEFSQEELAQSQAQANQEQLQAELQAEKRKLEELKKVRNPNSSEIRAQNLKVLELSRQLLEGEAKLFDAYIAVLKSKLEDTARAYSNEVEKQNQQLQRQTTLIGAVNRALEQRTNLLKASQDLLKGTSDFLTNELDALAKIENSELRKKELARASAVIKLAALQQEQVIAQQLFEIEQQRNRLALERRDIENQVAIAKAKADIAKGAVEVKVAEQQFRAGRIDKSEFDAKVLEQSARVIGLQGLNLERGLITQERALQPQLEAAARQQFRLRQRSEETNAYAQVIETLAPSQRAAGRNFLRQRVASEYGFSNAGDFRSALNGEVQGFIGQQFFGQQGNANPFTRFGPNGQRLINGLNPSQVQLPNGLPTALPGDLTATLGEIDKVAKGVKPGFKLPQAKGVQLTPAALEARSATLSPDLMRDTLTQNVKATQALTKVLEGVELLKSNPGNIIQIPSMPINVYSQGGDRQAAQSTGQAVRQQLDTIFKKAEATARSTTK